jgi:mannose-6-phosphate isomerase-like protein (cupin superfamily)
MDQRPINIAEKFAKFSDQWAPRIVAQMNDYHFKLVRVQGEFVWHSHPETDEVFFVVEGELTIHFRDSDLTLKPGELVVVPRGVEHKPSAARECKVMLVEPAGTANTGDAGGPRTAADGVWI